MHSLLIVSASALLIAGCAGQQSAPTPPPTSPSAAPSPTPSATPELIVPLATVEDALETLKTGPNDDRAPEVSYAAVLVPNQPETYRNERTDIVSGTVRLRVTCVSDESSTVHIEFSTGTAEPVSVDAPCAAGFVTSQGEPFTIIGPYQLSMQTTALATAGIGIIRE